MIFDFLLLQTNFYLLQTDGVSKIILNQQPIVTDGLRAIRDFWDADEWGRITPGVCIRRG